MRSTQVLRNSFAFVTSVLYTRLLSCMPVKWQSRLLFLILSVCVC